MSAAPPTPVGAGRAPRMKSDVILSGRGPGHNPARPDVETNRIILIIPDGPDRIAGSRPATRRGTPVPQTRRYHYAPRQTDEFVGELLYARDGTTERDFDLYRDLDTAALFVVASVSYRVGQTLTNSHTCYTVDEFLALDPGNRRRMDEVMRV